MKRFVIALVILGVVACVLLQSDAATTPNSIVTAQTPNVGRLQFLQGTDVAGTYKTLYTGGANGSRCNGMWITSNDATSHLITIQIVNGSVKYGGLSINTGTTSPGFANAAPPVNALAAANWTGLPVDSDGNPYIQLSSASDTIQATFATALTSTTVVNIVASCADF